MAKTHFNRFNPLEIGSTLQKGYLALRAAPVGLLFQSPRNRVNTSKTTAGNMVSSPISPAFQSPRNRVNTSKSANFAFLTKHD